MQPTEELIDAMYWERVERARRMSFETVTATSRYVLHLVDNPFCIELFLLSDDAHDVERFARRRRNRFGDRDVSLPTVEDVIITKLRWSALGGERKTLTTSQM